MALRTEEEREYVTDACSRTTERGQKINVPVSAEHSYPGLNVGTENTETPQSGEGGQEDRQGKCLQSRSEMCQTHNN